MNWIAQTLADAVERRRLALVTASAVLLIIVAACGEADETSDTVDGDAATAPAQMDADSTIEATPVDVMEATPAQVMVAVTDLEGREVLIGTDATYRPFEFVDDAGEIVGIDPDLMTAICEIANCVATFQNTSWDGIFAALSAREFDAIMSAITILDEREELSNGTFTVPYFEVGQVVLVRADSGVQAPQDIAAMTVGVQTGTTGDIAAVEELGVPDEDVNRYETIVLAVEALSNGDVDAVVLDNPTAEIFVGMHDDLRIAGEPFTTEQYGILVPNASPDILSAFNNAIEELQSQRRIDEIVQTWYADVDAPTEE